MAQSKIRASEQLFFDADVNINSKKLTSVAEPTADQDAATKNYVDQKVRGLDWSDSILDQDLSAPPGSPSSGDRYIVKPTGTGAWSGHNNEIAQYNGSSWEFDPLNEGVAVWVEDENIQIVWNGTIWALMGAAVPAHGLVSATHTVSGLTTGHFLKALSATTFGFEAHGLNAGDVGAETADATILKEGDVDDIPVDAATLAPISSNWAFDHETSHNDVLVDADIGGSVQAHATVLDNTTAAFTTTLKTKLDGVEALADVTDATNVASAGAVMDSDISAGEGILRKTGAGAYIAMKTNLSATVAPNNNDDLGSGYVVGSLWLDVTADQSYVCIDGTNTSAIWIKTSRFTASDESKLDAIEALADVTDVTNVTSAGALMDSELTNLAAVKAINQSLISGAVPTFTTTNFTDATNKRFMTDAQETILDAISGTNTGDEPNASLTVKGIIEIATVSETNTGTDATRAVSPDGINDWTGGAAKITKLATIATGVWQGTAINQTYLVGQSGTNTGDEPNASATLKGIVELATIAEVNTGTDTTRAVTPDALEGSALQIKVDGVEALADVTSSNETSHGDVVVDGDFTANGFMKRTGAGAYTVDTAAYFKESDFVHREIPGGTKNGSNVTFTLANTPTSGTECLYVNGMLQNAGAGNDYTISGLTITMLTAPISTDTILANYKK